MKLFLFDTETTDNKNQRIVQLAYKRIDVPSMKEEASKVMMFKPPVPIEIGAMAVHHITNEAVSVHEPFEKVREPMQSLLNSCVPVAHNAIFDLQSLRNEGLTVSKDIPHICTYKVAVHLLPDFEYYKLQYLRYALKVDQIQFHEMQAHDAMADVLVLEAVLYGLIWKFIETDPELSTCEDAAKAIPQVIQKMIDICAHPILYPKIRFGKYKGMTFSELRLRDKGYLQWLLDAEGKKIASERDEDLLYTVQHYLQ